MFIFKFSKFCVLQFTSNMAPTLTGPLTQFSNILGILYGSHLIPTPISHYHHKSIFTVLTSHTHHKVDLHDVHTTQSSLINLHCGIYFSDKVACANVSKRP